MCKSGDVERGGVDEVGVEDCMIDRNCLLYLTDCLLVN